MTRAFLSGVWDMCFLGVSKALPTVLHEVTSDVTPNHVMSLLCRNTGGTPVTRGILLPGEGDSADTVCQ